MWNVLSGTRCFSIHAMKGFSYARTKSLRFYATGFPSSRGVKMGVLRPLDILEEAKLDWINENSQLSTGPKLKSLPGLGNILGPFREGELSIFTGPTGTGKTTVLSQISLDYASQGIGTLWCSFEIRNSRLVRVMLQQVSDPPVVIDPRTGKWDDASLEVLKKSCELFSHLPLAFLEAYGSTPTREVLDVLQEAVQQKDHTGRRKYTHVILDNLQFMLSNQYHSSLDKYDVSDRTISALRNFASDTNTHVTLVIHPRKELDDTFLGLSSISGTAKATQEADNVIILQKINSRRFLDVKKNRFSGELGRVEISFIPASRLVRELTNEEKARRAQEVEQSPGIFNADNAS